MARKSPQAKALEAVAERFSAFRPAREALRVVRAVPTRFPQVDHALRVNGWPIECFTLIHGPSGDGKTEFAIGLEDSFLARDHFAFHIDAERTTPITWVEQLMGARAMHPRFFAVRPESYEATIADVRNFLNALVAAKEAEEISEDTSALVVVDSLRKLVPANLMKEILESEAEAKDVKGGRDRSAQLQAKMNAAWMDELVPLLERAGAGFVAIAREMQDPDADMWAKKFGTDYKIAGGGAIYYDASVVARVERVGWIGEGEGKDRKTYGERRRVTIRKTKVAGKEDRTAVAHFHSSNGVLVPAGFDQQRDVLEMAKRFAIVDQKGSWFTFEGERVGNGEHNAVRRLHEDAPLFDRLHTAVRSAFEKYEPVEHDPATGEVSE
jgi:recombination protein RecA